MSVESECLLVVERVGFGESYPLSVDILLDARLDEEVHAGIRYLVELRVADVYSDVEHRLLRVSVAVDGTQRVSGDDDLIRLVGLAALEILPVDRSLAGRVGIDAENNAPVILRKRRRRLVVQCRQELSLTVRLTGDAHRRDSDVRIVEIDLSVRGSIVVVSEVCRYRVVKIGDDSFSLCDGGENRALSGSNREVIEGLIVRTVVDADRYTVDSVDTLILHREADRYIRVRREGREVDVYIGNSDLVLVERVRGVDRDGLLRNPSGSGLCLSVNFILKADFFEILFFCAVGDGVHYHPYGHSVRVGVRVEVTGRGIRRKNRRLSRRGERVSVSALHELHHTDDVVVRVARAGVIVNNRYAVKSGRAVRQSETPVKLRGINRASECLRHIADRRAVLVKHAEPDVMRRSTRDVLAPVPAENEISARGREFGRLVGDAVRRRSYRLAAVLDVRGVYVNDHVVDFAVVSASDRERECRRAIVKHFRRETGDASVAAVVERVGLIAPLASVVNSAKYAILLELVEALAALNRAPCRYRLVPVHRDDRKEFLRAVVCQSCCRPACGIAVPDRRHDLETVQKRRLLFNCDLASRLEPESSALAEPYRAREAIVSVKIRRAVAVTGEAIVAVGYRFPILISGQRAASHIFYSCGCNILAFTVVCQHKYRTVVRNQLLAVRISVFRDPVEPTVIPAHREQRDAAGVPFPSGAVEVIAALEPRHRLSNKDFRFVVVRRADHHPSFRLTFHPSGGAKPARRLVPVLIDFVPVVESPVGAVSERYERYLGDKRSDAERRLDSRLAVELEVLTLEISLVGILQVLSR